MPIRIYSLAKELGIENKELVDVCAKVGIHGKGSALASLTDEEVSQVKSHLSGESAPAAPKKATEPIRPATPPVQRPVVKPPVSEKPPAARAAHSPRPGRASLRAKKSSVGLWRKVY